VLFFVKRIQPVSMWGKNTIAAATLASLVACSSGNTDSIEDPWPEEPCAAGLTLCGDDICTSLEIDSYHCGTCGNACPRQHMCSGGECREWCITEEVETREELVSEITLETSHVGYWAEPSGRIFHVPGPISLEASTFSDGLNEVLFEAEEGVEGVTLDGLTEFETYDGGSSTGHADATFEDARFRVGVYDGSCPIPFFPPDESCHDEDPLMIVLFDLCTGECSGTGEAWCCGPDQHTHLSFDNFWHACLRMSHPEYRDCTDSRGYAINEGEYCGIDSGDADSPGTCHHGWCEMWE
jgi:hypothetical protein